MISTTRKALLLGLLMLVALPATAQWTYHSPLNMTSADPAITIRPGIPSTTARITSTSAGDLQWVQLGLSMPGNVEIDSVTVCYEMDGGAFISQVRVTNMTTPDASPVIVDLGTDLLDPGPVCVTQPCTPFSNPSGTKTLALRLNFTEASGVIQIGSIGVHTRPVVVSAVDDNQPPSRLPTSILAQNHPNPFNPSTLISFDLARTQRVQLDIYSIDGRHLRSLVNGRLDSGRHEMTWNGRDDNGRTMSSGVYLYRLATEQGEETRRMTLVR